MTATSMSAHALDESRPEIEQRLVQGAIDMREEILAQASTVEERTFYSEDIHRRF